MMALNCYLKTEKKEEKSATIRNKKRRNGVFFHQRKKKERIKKEKASKIETNITTNRRPSNPNPPSPTRCLPLLHNRNQPPFSHSLNPSYPSNPRPPAGPLITPMALPPSSSLPRPKKNQNQAQQSQR
ncbi:hypothetical protein V6Z11_D01G128800 [Gossypium hirsutum]